MKLIEDRKVCWQDQYQGWHVGVTFLRGGMEVRRGKETLVRHKHTGELEMVNSNWIKDYPMEPIPEPGQSSIVDQILERERQSMEEMAESGWPHTPPVDDIAKAKELVAKGKAWFDDLERHYLK